MNEVEKLILFPATSPWIEDGSAGELGIESTAVRRTRNRTLSQEVRVVARSSEKLRVLSLRSLRLSSHFIILLLRRRTATSKTKTSPGTSDFSFFL